MVARIGRMVDRLERQGKQDDKAAIEVTLATVRLSAYVNRLLALLDISRPPQLDRNAAHEWAVEDEE